MKVVVANSIGVDSRGNYIIHSPSRWSEGVRNRGRWFAYYPWELAYCSSLLKRHTSHHVKFVDGCLERLNYKRYFEKIAEERPDWLVIESATRMIDENLNLAKEVKKRLGTKIIFVGHHASVFPEYILHEGIDFVCIGEYEYTVLEIVQGKDVRDILGLYPNKRRPFLDIDKLPWPEDEDVSRLSYGIPGEPSSEYLEIQMYASRGCPRSCNFCVARNVYYSHSNWRPRDISNIIDEIKYLRNKYPKMEGIFFDEEEHNVSKDFILKFTAAIIENRLQDLHYEAMCDIRALDREMMAAMHEAGYYKIRVGIETINQGVGLRSSKELDINNVIQKLKEAKEIGLKTYGTFMMGMPGSSKEIDLKTSLYIENMILDGFLDNVQISICTPQPGTPFYNYAKEKKYIITENYKNYDGGRHSVLSYPRYSSKSIESVMNYAFRIREHASFLRNLRRGEILKWVWVTYKRHGFFSTVVKLIKRIQLESFHFLFKRVGANNLYRKELLGGIKTKPHILNIVHKYHPSIGGAEIYMKEISERLVREGYSVTVFTTDAWDLEHLWKRGKRSIKNYREILNGVEIERFRAVKLPFHLIIMRLLYQLPFLFTKTLFSLPSPVVPGMWKRLFLTNHFKFDVVHIASFPYNSLIYMGILFAKRHNLPLVITPLLHLGECKNDKVNRYYTRGFQIKLLQKCDKIIVQTAIERGYLKNSGIDEDKICLVGQGVNLKDIQGGDAERFRKRFDVVEKKIVFHVSTKSYDKGTFHLIEAMKEIWKEDEDIKLVLAGPPMDEFNKYFSTETAFVKNKCLVLDYIIGEDKKDLFAAGDIFVLPSRTDSFGAVFLEAWVNRKPVIGARAGGVAEVINHNEDGYLVKFGDVSELAAYIKLLLQDKNFANEMGRKGYLKVCNGWTWDERYKFVKGLLDNII